MQIVAVPTTPTSVFALLGEDQRTAPINIQAAKANAADVSFGNRAHQPFFLVPGAAVEISEVNSRNVYLVGQAGDFVALGIF